MSSKIKVDTIENVAGSGNVSLGSGHNLVVPGNITGQGTVAITSNATVGGTLGVTGTSVLTGNVGIGTSASTGNNPLVVQAGSGAGGINLHGRSSDNTATMLIGKSADGNTAYNTITSYANRMRIQSGFSSDTNTMEFFTNDVSRVVIDASGRVTMPGQPCFSATHPSGSQLTTDTTYRVKPHNTIITNVGNCYSTAGGGSRFTAPVAGTYMFTCFALQLANVSSNLIFGKNGSHTTMGSTGEIRAISGSDEANIAGQVILTLAENDYVEVFYRRTGGSGSFYAAHGGFSGFLIG